MVWHTTRRNKGGKSTFYIILAGIPTAVHYPMPLHVQECFKYLNLKEGDFPISEKVSKEIMSLPMNPYVSDEEIEFIVGSLAKELKC